MLIKEQFQFTEQQVEQLDELRRQTGATRTELVRRAVDKMHSRNAGAWRPKGLATVSDKRRKRDPMKTTGRLANTFLVHKKSG